MMTNACQEGMPGRQLTHQQLNKHAGKQGASPTHSRLCRHTTTKTTQSCVCSSYTTNNRRQESCLTNSCGLGSLRHRRQLLQANIASQRCGPG